MLRSVAYLRQCRDRLSALGSVAPEERRLAGRVCGTFWILGGVTFASFLVLPGVPAKHPGVILALAGSGLALGIALLALVDWDRTGSWPLHLCTASAYAAIAGAVASSGGVRSPAWSYLFFAGLFSAYFFQRPVAIVYLFACVFTHALVILYDPQALHDAFLGQLVIASAGYLVLGGAIIAGRERLAELRDRAEHLAAEQSALRRVATAVVNGCPPDQIYAMVAEELSGLLRVGVTAILRRESGNRVVVMGSRTERAEMFVEPGTVIEVKPGSSVVLAIQTGKPAQTDTHPAGSVVGSAGYGPSVAVPIHVGGRIWGVLAVTARPPERLKTSAEARLMAFGNLLSTAILAIEDRAKLAVQASSDPLTGLANHRAVRQRLAEEVALCAELQAPLSVVVLDIDHFKQINDAGGHEAGDEILQIVARSLYQVARSGDTLGRVGGDEFIWILPDATVEQALAATERLRALLTTTVPDPTLVTISAGICDTHATGGPAELIRLADRALYWSKAHGRDQCRIYDPAVVGALSAEERAQRLGRSRALVGLRSLATAIDAKDPATREHSERVAALAGRLAVAAGWSNERARLLSEAALVHDVGKIGVPDAVLCKPAPLTADEREQMQAHAELAARIVEGVLSPEQVDWIRSHHERPDGRGYPRGLRAPRIPQGAALLAIADAWDVMTTSRCFGPQKTVAEALEECRSLVGRQFSRSAVEALLSLHERGELTAEADLPVGGRLTAML